MSLAGITVALALFALVLACFALVLLRPVRRDLSKLQSLAAALEEAAAVLQAYAETHRRLRALEQAERRRAQTTAESNR
jgi:hypothetical protein